jgi:RNA polymerase sigma-70 factor (ECF subfamily)
MSNAGTERLGDQLLSRAGIQHMYERHGPALVAYACSYLSDAAAAEDVVHNVFERLLRGIAVPEQSVGYLYRAVRNTALNVLRDGARMTVLEESYFVHRNGDHAAALALHKALASLTEEQREVVIMRIWGGLTLEETATATSAPLNTVASRYRYAIEKLRDLLGPNAKPCLAPCPERISDG